MGHEKKRRKSAGALPAQPAKERRIVNEYPSWNDHSGYTVLQLLDKQTVRLVGEATLQVLHGAVRVSGKLVTVESSPLLLSTGGRFSLAISITAEAHVPQVPFAAYQQVVEVSLQSRPPLLPKSTQTAPPTVSITTATDSQGPLQPLQQRQALGREGVGREGAGAEAAAAGAASTSSASSFSTFSLYRLSDPRVPPSLVISSEWGQLVDSVCNAAAAGEPLVLAVLGAKGMGKSSLARLSANQLLDVCPWVAFLDTDVGQPEFNPPGLLSLHLLDPGSPAVGPPHAHSRRPWAARFVGDVSPQHDPQLYLSAVQALYGSYWSWAQSLVASGAAWPPLVVNTHGWVKGLGFDLLTQLLRVVAPTHVVQIRGGSEKKNLPRGAFWCDPRVVQEPATAATAAAAAAAPPPTVLINLATLADAPHQAAPAAALLVGQDTGGGGAATTSSGGGCSTDAQDREALGAGRARGGGGSSTLAVTLRSLKPVESRALAWHAWAKRVLGCDPAWGTYESEDFWRNAGALASLQPWKVSLDELHVQLLAGSLAPQQLGRVINGAVVGLLATSPPPPAPPPPAAAAAAAAAWWDLDAAAAAASYPPGRISYIGASATPPLMLPCVGLGIVRAVDMESRTAYVLTDVDGDVLECVGVLVVGRLELPGSLVVGGEVAWPYQQLFGLSAEATGAGASKARKNLSRSSLVELAG